MNDHRSSTRRLAPDAGGIAQAAAILAAGGTVAFPTETVYGLGADAADPGAVVKIYEAKGRPRFNPLIAHCASLEAARREGVFGEAAARLAAAFWPGPLTLVVPLAATARVCDLARAGLDSVALRVPDHPIARALLAAFGGPVVAPSANRSGHVSPTGAAHVFADLDGRIDAVIEGGACPVGVESTILSCLGAEPVLLRAGGVPREEIEAVLGHPLVAGGTDPDAPVAPGQLLSHYAPRAPVRLDATLLEPGEAGLDFGGQLRADGGPVLDLSPSGDLREASRNLFAHLRALDAMGPRAIAVAPVPATRLGEAIRDRLARAAAGR